MTRAKTTTKAKTVSKPSPRRKSSPAPGQSPVPPGDQSATNALSLHELFQQQVATMLESSALDDEQRQNILVAMSCPCCGTGMSYTAKLKRKE
jgi:hypothetical protein